MTIAEYKKEYPQALRQATLCLLIRDDEILLAMKKRGFGKDRWNGVGGKPGPGEPIRQAAIREAKEEIGVDLKELELCAVLNFYFPHQPDWSQQVVVYFCHTWNGTPTETEEMKPQWFKWNALPLDAMWPSDKHWLPLVLDGANVKADCLFGENDTVLEFDVQQVAAATLSDQM